MRLLLIVLFSVITHSGLFQEPCVTFYNEELQERSIYDYTSPEGQYRIKCVVHIFYNEQYENSNISDDINYSAMQSLNSDVSQAGVVLDLKAIEHHDIAEHIFGDIILAGGMCFPYVDANGYANIPMMSYFASEYAWDVSEYLNIYVIPFSCQYNYGFSFIYPLQTNYADGVWINYHAWGLYGDHLEPNRNLNKTVTHEFGHYAGLLHVFQGIDFCGEAGDCLLSQDRVCDTAPTKINWTCSNPTCPPAWNSLQPWAAYEHNNHMDYYIDSCRTTFTAGQVERMRWYLSTRRIDAIDILSCNNDVTGDYVVGADDLLCILSCQESTCCDVTGDGYTGTLDLLQILSEYGNNCNYLTE